MEKLKTKLSKSLPYLIVVAAMIIIATGSAVAGAWFKQQERPVEVATESTVKQKEPSSAQKKDTKQEDQSDTSDSISSDGRVETSADQKTTTSSLPSSSSSSSGSSGSTSSTAISVQLAVNGANKGTVTLSSGSNQCSVLTKALQTGLIGSLDMRYSSQYKTQAVYSINGVGDPNNIWWTYTVNGTSPPYGCSQMPARSGDSVNWQYVK